MKATYLVRIDDLCPTTNWAVWDRVEELLERLDVCPILAVVPDNQDPVLRVGTPDDRFWDRVRSWQQRGWMIAVHGYQHVYVTGESGIVGINRRSEFAGLPADDQREKLRRSLEIFRDQGVGPSVWTAPSHSFDATTVSELKRAGIACINEGLFPFPYRDDAGMMWVPHQMWRFHEMPTGVWTIGIHLNKWTDRDIASFGSDLRSFRSRIADLETVIDRYGSRRQGVLEPVASIVYRGALKARLALRRIALASS